MPSSKRTDPAGDTLPIVLPAPPEQPAATVEQLVERAMFDRRVELATRKALGPGPVYQGVSRQIRKLVGKGQDADGNPLPVLVDPLLYAGQIAAARSLARAVDKHTGHNPSGWVSSGRDLGPLFEQLRELMAELAEASGAKASGNALLDWLNSDDEDAPREPAGADLR